MVETVARGDDSREAADEVCALEIVISITKVWSDFVRSNL